MAFPDLPGIPALLPVAGLAVSGIPTAAGARSAVFGTIVATGWQLVSGGQEWAIFKNVKGDDGKTKKTPFFTSNKFQSVPSSLRDIVGNVANTLGVIEQPSFNSMDYSKEVRVANFPIEKGGFAAYNKVQTPGLMSVTFCMGGSEAERKEFIDTIDGASNTNEVYTIVTPGATYIDYTMGSYGYSRRVDSGAQLIILTVDITQIRSVESERRIGKELRGIRNADVKNPEGHTPKDIGRVQPSPPGESVLRSISNSVLSAANQVKSGVSRFFTYVTN